MLLPSLVLYFTETLIHRAFEAIHADGPPLESDAIPASLIVPKREGGKQHFTINFGLYTSSIKLIVSFESAKT